MTVTRRSALVSEPVSIAADPLPVQDGPTSDLAQRLGSWTEDRELCARDLVLATARELCDWTLDWPEEWDAARIGSELERGFAPWAADQAWRGPCAQFLDTLRRTWWGFRDLDRDELQGVFAEEVGLWLWSIEEGLEAFGEHDVAWNGEPLARGRRLPLRREAARHAADTLAKGDIVLATAWSETLALALELAWKAGKKPHLLMGESLPWLDGRRMARRVVPEGVRVTLVYDAALLRELERADRVWTPAEAVGARAFATRVGTRTLLEAARAREIPVDLVTTSDKLVPGGELALPRWCKRTPELLWDGALEGVTLELDCYEAVPLELTPEPITEAGRERVADLALRALRAEPESPCGAFDRARA
ncbi:MAG: hypothetical protein IPJ77_23925 [Planctomycetes bacterium]|nr:hypothetical protein [Planctomycetota bacterium]